MKWLSDHNAEICMRPLLCACCKQQEAQLVMITIAIGKGKEIVWANIVENLSKWSLRDYFKLAVKELKEKTDGLNS